MPPRVPWQELFHVIIDGADPQAAMEAAAIGFVKDIFAGRPPLSARTSAFRRAAPAGSNQARRPRRTTRVEDAAAAFRLFGLDPLAPEADYKARFRELALRAHPDRAGGSESRMRRVNTAWDLIRAVRGWK